MGYTVIIAEKPSVAASIAKVVGATTPHRDKANGYLEGNGYKVTWAFGHLVGLDRPEDMGFTGEVLPIFPEEWHTHIIQSSKADMSATIVKQVKTIDGLFGSADRIIVATDAGREGELIFRYIYEYLGCKTPFDRLWISSLTDEAIRKGLSNLRSGREMNSMSEAAHARSEADWLMGFNASRALRLASGYKGNLSLGRVQTPVLCMICKRFEDNKNFVPTPFWQITALVHKDMVNFPVISVHHYQTENAAKEAAAAVEASKTFHIKNVETKDVASKPPLLYDLTSLQRAANTKYGLTADETLKIAQGLYEKKFLSYPRTGSRYIPEDVYKTIPSLIKKISSYGRQSFQDACKELDGKKLCRKSVDDTKVTDHHALLPTEVVPTSLAGNEQKIWELVCGRMLEAFGEDSISRRTTVELECASIPFKTSGSILVKAGWKAVFGTTEEEEEKANKTENGSDDDDLKVNNLPKLSQGENLPGTKVETVRKTDKPQPIYTDSSLLGEMETCGKKIDDEELRESMKDVGLGTPATRAAIIEVLIQRGYIVRTGKKLTPTELGSAIAKTVNGRKIADVKTTGEWERELALIESGKKSKSDFDKAIKNYVLEIIDDLQKNCTSFAGVSASSEPTRTCPLCGKKMKNLKFSITCDTADGGCGAMIPREIAFKKLPLSAINALCEGKTTALIKGFTAKSGKLFEARLQMSSETKKPAFVFENKGAGSQTEDKKCPCCGNTMKQDNWKYTCDCGFTLFKSYGKVPLTENEINLLLSGKSVKKTGMTNQAGKKYDATLSVDTEQKKVVFTFPNKKK